ncbi:hypothetical protein ATCC90586_003778 [Pythium insidiosum]|nr:hypothetical protein ATCC90586_003778 [Pythium insidiosum]
MSTTTTDSAAPMSLADLRAQATACVQAGDHEAAVDWWTRAVSAAGESEASAALLVQRAESQLELGHWLLAERDAQAAMERRCGRRYVRALRAKCRALLGGGRREDALAAWKEVMTVSSDVLDTLAFQCEFGESVDDKDQVTDDSSSKHAMRYADALGFLSRRDFGNVVRCVTTQLDSSRHNRRDAVLFLLRARARFELKEFANAVKDIERVLTLLPTATEGYLWLAQAFIGLQQPHNARRVCTEGLKVAPTNAALLALKASLTKVKSKRASHQAASEKSEERTEVQAKADADEELDASDEDPVFALLRDLKKQLKLTPTDTALYSRRARVRLDLKQFELAQDDAANAISLDPQGLDGYVCSVTALLGMRRYPKARRVCEQGLLFHPSNDELTKLLQRIDDAATQEPMEDGEDSLQSRTLPRRIPKAVAKRKKERADRKATQAADLRASCTAKARDLVSSRDYGNAVFHINKALGYTTNENDAELLVLRARCRFYLKQWELVREDSERAISLDPQYIAAYQSLAQVLKAMGRTSAAMRVCEDGLRVATSTEEERAPLETLHKWLITHQPREQTR